MTDTTTATDRLPSNRTITDDHVTDAFGDVESGLNPVEADADRLRFEYVSDARNYLRRQVATVEPDTDGPTIVRLDTEEFGYSWPHTHGGEKQPGEWTRQREGPALRVRVDDTGIVTEWADGSDCQYAGLHWTAAARQRFARTITKRFAYDDLADHAHDYLGNIHEYGADRGEPIMSNA